MLLSSRDTSHNVSVPRGLLRSSSLVSSAYHRQAVEMSDLQQQLTQKLTGMKRPRIYDRSTGREEVKRYHHLVKTWKKAKVPCAAPFQPVIIPEARQVDAIAHSTGATSAASGQRASREDVSSTRTAPASKSQRVVKMSKTSRGRTFTSKYRGVHQTFPTRRWEAQFRRGGKPTSLGCFDNEKEAAQAYDRMMIWCHLHKELSCKHGITNYDMKKYEADYEWLMSVTQEELIESLRSDGRRQAATRQLRMKQQGVYGLPATQFEEEKQRLMHRPLIWETMTSNNSGGATGAAAQCHEAVTDVQTQRQAHNLAYLASKSQGPGAAGDVDAGALQAADSTGVEAANVSTAPLQEPSLPLPLASQMQNDAALVPPGQMPASVEHPVIESDASAAQNA